MKPLTWSEFEEHRLRRARYRRDQQWVVLFEQLRMVSVLIGGAAGRVLLTAWYAFIATGTGTASVHPPVAGQGCAGVFLIVRRQTL
jgi:hypothetical protein